MPKKATKTKNTILSGVPGMTAWADIKHGPYTGQIADFSGQLRCYTGVQGMGKDRINLIKPHQFASKREKYPELRVLETVK